MESETILIVDDEEIVSQSLQAILEAMGYFVMGVLTTGEAAIERLNAVLPDLILMDINLAGKLDGIATAAKIREHHDIPLIYITGLADTATVERAKVTAPVGFLVKPFERQELQRTIDLALYKHQMEQQLRKKDASIQAVQNRLAGIVGVVQDAIISINEHQKLVSFNSGAEKMFGYSANQIIGQQLEILMPERFHETHHHHVKDFEHGPEQNRTMGQRRLLIGRRRDGSEFPCEGTIAKLVIDKETIMTVVLRDITYRNQLEARLGAIHQLGQELTLIHEEDTIVEQVLKSAANTLKFDIAICGLIDESTNSLCYTRKLVNGVLDTFELGIPIGKNEVVDSTFVSMIQPTSPPPTYQKRRFIPMFGVEPKSDLCAPLFANGKLIGMLNGGSTVLTSYTSDDLKLLQTLADQAAVALENARLYANINQHSHELTILNQASQAMASTLDPNTILEQLVERVKDLLDSEVVSVLLLEDETSRELVYKIVSNSHFEVLVEDKIPLDEDFLGTALRDLRPKIVPNVHNHPLIYQKYDLLTGLQAGPLVYVPLVYQSRMVGVVELVVRTAVEVELSDLLLLESMASSAAIAIDNARLYQSEKTNRQALEAVRRAALSLTASLNLDEVLEEIVHNVLNLISGQHAHIFLVQEEKLVFGIALGEDGYRMEPVAIPRPNGLTYTTFHKGRYILVPDMGNHPLYQDIDDPLWRGSILALPLKIGETVLGVMTIYNSLTHAFTQGNIKIPQLLADQAAIAIENARLFDAEQKARKTAETLQDANMALSQTLELDMVLEILLDLLARLVTFDRACILLAGEAGQMQIKATVGYDVPENSDLKIGQIRFEIETTPNLQTIVSTGMGLVIPDVKKYPGWREILSEVGARCWMGVPLTVGKETFGIYSLEKDEPGFYNEKYLELVEQLAAPASIAIKNALLYQETQDQLKRLHESQFQLVQSAKVGALGRLAASVSHEINNPLQVVHNSLTLMQEDLDVQNYDSSKRYLNIMVDEIDRISKIVVQMRDFYRPAKEEDEIVDIYDVLTNVILLASTQLEESNVRLSFQWAKAVPLVKGNGAHLKQVFLNFILNALDAMPQGGELLVNTWLGEMYSSNGGQVQPAVGIEFRDSGHGISSEIQARLFEPFFTTKEEGTGLGLAVSHGIISAHGGQIQVESEVGKGTAFIVLLPRAV